MAKIEIRNLTKSFPCNDNHKNMVLQNVDCDFPSKGLIAIEGKSGSGKSTLLKLIIGLEKIEKGDILIDGKRVSQFKEKDFVRLRQKEVAYIHQAYPTLETFTVLDNLCLPIFIRNEKEDLSKTINRAQKLLNKYTNDINENQLCKELSGGQRQRVCILRALIMNTPVILADEPTGSLDQHNSYMVMDILKKVSIDRLVIMVTHNHELARKYADQILYLERGALYEMPQ